MNHLKERYQSGYYMETASECPGFVVPPSIMNWRYQGISKGDKTGPLRDVWYMLEYLGAEVGNNISQIPGAPHKESLAEIIDAFLEKDNDDN